MCINNIISFRVRRRIEKGMVGMASKLHRSTIIATYSITTTTTTTTTAAAAAATTTTTTTTTKNDTNIDNNNIITIMHAYLIY